jgi:hypothetical protein
MHDPLSPLGKSLIILPQGLAFAFDGWADVKDTQKRGRSAMTTHGNRPRFQLVTNDDVSTSTTSIPRLTGSSHSETEALARFAAEFLNRASWNQATPEGMEKAYLATIPVEYGDEDLHLYMQELGQRVYGTLRADFRVWADRSLSVGGTTCTCQAVK